MPPVSPRKKIWRERDRAALRAAPRPFPPLILMNFTCRWPDFTHAG